MLYRIQYILIPRGRLARTSVELLPQPRILSSFDTANQFYRHFSKGNTFSATSRAGDGSRIRSVEEIVGGAEGGRPEPIAGLDVKRVRGDLESLFSAVMLASGRMVTQIRPPRCFRSDFTWVASTLPRIYPSKHHCTECGLHTASVPTLLVSRIRSPEFTHRSIIAQSNSSSKLT